MKTRNFIAFFIILMVSAIAIASVSGFTQDRNQDFSCDFFDEVKDSECSSIILQVSNNESVASFRRDEPGAADIFIENGTFENIGYIKQYKTEGGEFFQCLITENGYVVGVGGGTDGAYNKQIENITHKMILSENPSKYIGEIQKILNGYKKGHFIIKAPDGSYNVVWPSGNYHGKLNDGQYVCVPNMEKYSFAGNFTGDPISESIKIAGKDIFGISRRDIITYDYKTNESGSFVDVYATNDDGSIKGSDTGSFYDDVYYMGELHKGNSLPMIPDKVKLGTYDFKQSCDFFGWLWSFISKGY